MEEGIWMRKDMSELLRELGFQKCFKCGRQMLPDDVCWAFGNDPLACCKSCFAGPDPKEKRITELEAALSTRAAEHAADLAAKNNAESRIAELEAEVERLQKKCTGTAFAWTEAVDKYETCDVDNEQLKATLRDRETTIVSQQDELHALRLGLDKSVQPNDDCIKECTYLRVQADISSDLRRKIVELNLCLVRCETAALGYDDNCEDTNVPGLPGYSEARSRIGGLFKESLAQTMRAEAAEATLADHLTTHLCLERHGADEKPDRDDCYWDINHDGNLFFGYYDSIQKCFCVIGGGHLSWRNIKEWYALAKRSEG